MVEYVYKCDHCKEKVVNKKSFFHKSTSSYNKLEQFSSFLSRKYNIDFYMVVKEREICQSCAKKAIIDIGQQFLTDKVTGKENDI